MSRRAIEPDLLQARIEEMTRQDPHDPRLEYIDLCQALGHEEVAALIAVDVPPGMSIAQHVEAAMQTWMPGFCVERLRGTKQ